MSERQQPDSEWTGDRRVTGFDSSLCVHGVGRTPGQWCGSCAAEAWRREYAPNVATVCAGDGCSFMGPCPAHVPANRPATTEGVTHG